MVEIRQETPNVRSLILDLPDWTTHLAGQHVDVRLTAEDGYPAMGCGFRLLKLAGSITLMNAEQHDEIH